MSGRPISRRRALGLLGLGTAGVAAGAIGWVASASGPATSLGPGASGERLRQPDLVSSRDGVLDVTLTADRGVPLAGRNTSAYGYNGSSPGPTLRVRPGDQLRVRLVNHLDRPTNLHTHGLHVPPNGSGDNPFRAVEPGTTADYAIVVPADHPAGTYWYHPHHHGVAADQVFGGLVGAIVVADTDLPVTDDRVILVTDITLDGSGRVADPGPMVRMQGREGDLVLVNGQHQPVIAAAPGARYRWRIINGCVSRVLAVRLEGSRLVQVAFDGAYLPDPVTQDRLVLAPGNRADVLVSPTGGGSYRLLSDPYDRGSAMMGGGTSRPVPLATMVVAGPAVSSPPMPVTLPVPAAPPDQVAARRRLTFAMGMGMGMGMRFTIDGRTFDPARDDQTVRLGSTEDWTVVNDSTMAHPFHLHTWPFQVLATSGGGAPAGIRQDVVLVPAGGWVRLRIPFVDYPGRSVYHCHTLDHEDLGMMATVNVRT